MARFKYIPQHSRNDDPRSIVDRRVVLGGVGRIVLQWRGTSASASAGFRIRLY